MYESPDRGAIEEQTRKLLRRAGVRGRFPTPVDDIVAAAGLTEPEQSMFSDFIVNQAPEHLRRAIRLLTGPVSGLLDRRAKEIHLSPTVSTQGHAAFVKLHEATHQILPWQQDLAYADDAGTLSPAAKVLQEQEANVGASNLLFQHEAFKDASRQFKTGMSTVVALAETVGASIHATFRRYVATHDGTAAGVALELSPCSRDPLGYRRHEMVRYTMWEQEFGRTFWPGVLHSQPFSFVDDAERARSSTGVVRTEFVYPNLNNKPVLLAAELYSNRYRLLVLIWKPRRELLRKAFVVAG